MYRYSPRHIVPRARVVTPRWFENRQREVTAMQQERWDSPEADTDLLMPAAQHPLEDGRTPGKEFTYRLLEVASRYDAVVQTGGKAAVFLAGNRHHDKRTGQTDQVALYDAAGLFLLNRGIPVSDIHGPDWNPNLVYNGVMEIASLADVYHHNPRIRNATYVCSPGQKARAETYALAYGVPLEVNVPEALADAEEEQFHAATVQRLVLHGLARSIDPYGTSTLKGITANRLPSDGNTGTDPELLPMHSELQWYQTQ